MERRMQTPLPEYEIYAIRYATRESLRRDNFIGGDPHDGPMPLDYFVWAIVGPDKTYVVDTGFDAAVATKRGRKLLRCPSEGLAMACRSRARQGRDHHAHALRP